MAEIFDEAVSDCATNSRRIVSSVMVYRLYDRIFLAHPIYNRDRISGIVLAARWGASSVVDEER